MNLTPQQHHEDCDHRNAHNAGERHDCNLDCEAEQAELPHISHDELLQIIIGLERLRDDALREANKLRRHWPDQELAREDAAFWRAESVQAENLRQRLIDKREGR